MLAPPPLIYLVPLALGLLLHRRYPFELPGGKVTLVVGLACILAAAIVLPALLAFRRAATRPEPWRPATALVTEGPYRYVRHPQYTGLFLIIIGLLIQWPTLITALMSPVLFYVYYRLAKREEAEIEGQFGDRYRKYSATTPMFIPSLGGARP